MLETGVQMIDKLRCLMDELNDQGQHGSLFILIDLQETTVQQRYFSGSEQNNGSIAVTKKQFCWIDLSSYSYGSKLPSHLEIQHGLGFKVFGVQLFNQLTLI